MNNSANKSGFYYINEDVPEFVYISSCVYMTVIFLVGFVANTGVLIVFISSPMVMFFNPSIKNIIRE